MPRTFSIYEDKENAGYQLGSKAARYVTAPGRTSQPNGERAILADVLNISCRQVKAKSHLHAEQKVTELTKNKQVFNKASEHESGIKNNGSDPVKYDLCSFGHCTRSVLVFKTLNEKRDPLSGFDDYRVDVYLYLKACELQHTLKPYFMKKQPYLTPDMRSVLVDWLVEVALEYNLEEDSLYLAVGFVDRFLSRYCVKKNKLQLLGTAAMFLAAKYETVYPPGCHNFSYITAHTYSVDQILSMEAYILEGLSFNVLFPTILTFLNHISWDICLVEKIKNLSMFLCELVLVQGDPYFEFHPSLIASSVIAYSRNCLGFFDPWPVNLMKSTGYHIWDIYDVAHCIYETHSNAPKLKEQAVVNKYSKFDRDSVSLIKPKSFPVI